MNTDESDESGRDANVITIVTTATIIIIVIIIILMNIQLTVTYLVLDVQVRTSLCQSYSDVLVTPRRGSY